MINSIQEWISQWLAPRLVFILLVLLIIIVLVGVSVFRLAEAKDLLSGFIGVLAGSVLTLLLIYVGWFQLGQVSKTGSASFILRFKEAFFTPETRLLVHLLDGDFLEFVENADAQFFRVRKDKVRESTWPEDVKQQLLSKQTYSAYEFDDFLGHFEDLGMLEKQGVVDFEMVYGLFSWYIVVAWENCAICRYVRVQRKEEGEDVYEDFEYIYEKCKAREKSGN